MTPEITIVSANVDSPEWAELLIKSIRKFTQASHEIIIIDNGSLPENLTWLREQKDIRLIEMGHNAGHGKAMDVGTNRASGKYVCVVDIDAHFQRCGWDFDLIGLYESCEKLKLIGCRGPDHKPLKPPLFFFEGEFIRSRNISFLHIPNVSTDTAQKAYHDIIGMGFYVHRIVPWHKIYDCGGDEFNICNKPTIYHSWYGCRFQENNPLRTKAELDGYKLEDYLAHKAKLFNQGLVKEILGRVR